MGNHVHLLMKIGIEKLEQVMRRICGSYVYWYNNKYQRVGNLFQDRFKSEPVEDDKYLLVVQRYIHRNPIKAGLVKSNEQYKWSSFNEYVNKANMADVNFLLEIFNENKEKAVQKFIQYTNEQSDSICLDIDRESKCRITDEEAKGIIKKVCEIKNAIDLQTFEITRRNMYLGRLKEDYNLSIRQIERLTGINRGIVLKA